MKYDAKCAAKVNPAVGLEPSSGQSGFARNTGHLGFGTYDNASSGVACTEANGKQVVSTASGFPIAYIPESGNGTDNAEKYCSNNGWHLINNKEWMTIARNLEQVEANWCDRNGSNCGFAPGTKGKILANGHNDNNNEASAGGASSDSALFAGTDDQPCFGTTTDGSNTCGGKSSQKRTLTLNNGEIIWDFAGNVWQWVDDTVKRKDQPRSSTNGVPDKIFLVSDFAAGSLPSILTDNGQGPSMGYDAFRPSNPTWSAAQGVGRISHYNNLTGSVGEIIDTFIRGGNWKHGYDDGAFTFHLSPAPTKTDINDVGFRCVAPLQ
jgi:hypothetical protein